MAITEVQKSPAFGPAQIPIRDEWLSLHREPVIEPDLPIIDAHHHLWDRPGQRYLFDEFLSDARSGHNVLGSVYIQCRSMYKSHGPEELRPVGETEFANGVAARSASGLYGPFRACAGIVGFADLTLGSRVASVLQAHMQAAPQRFKGIRNMTASDPSSEISAGFGRVRGGMLREKEFHEGFAELAPLGLSADIWAYHPQLQEVIELARLFPETSIVLNHAGGPLNRGPYRENRNDVLCTWLNSLETLSTLPNVTMKLGGLCMEIGGLDFHKREHPPTSEQLADAIRTIIQPCLEIFGPQRCMFESNFSMDKGMTSYVVLWNAFKRVTADYPESEKHAMYFETARRIYRLGLE